MSGQYMRAEYSLFSEECAGKPAINGNGRDGRNGGTFPFIISASSVCSVAMTTNRYQFSVPVFFILCSVFFVLSIA